MQWFSPFSTLDAERVHSWLSEGGFVPRFSWAHRAYYQFLRPLLPVPWRQMFQRHHGKHIHPRANFIDPEMVEWVNASKQGRAILDQLYPPPYRFVFTLTHDVETAEGLARVPDLIRLEEKFGVRSSWNIVPFKYRIDEGILSEIRSAGHEVGVHGFNHDGRLFWNKAEFDRRAREINKVLERWGAVGFRAPMVHRHLEWMQALDILYDSSCFDYDAYQPFPGGVKSIWPFIAGKFVELPYTLPMDHTLLIVLQRRDASVWRTKAEWLIRHRGVVLLITHPDYLDSPSRQKIYAEFLEFLVTQPGAWPLLPRELALYWRTRWSDPMASASRATM